MNANSSLTIKDWQTQAVIQLDAAGIGTAKLDCIVLLEDVLSTDRAHLLAHPEMALTSEQKSELDALIARRIQHEPLSFIRGKTEFYGREFVITNHVLEPRPESETMIELLKKLSVNAPHIVDVGTGSGALAVTAKLEIPSAKVSAVDIDPNCLQVALANCKKHAADVKLHEGNLLEPIVSADVLLCNLPYVPDDFHINTAALHEPRIAIFGGADGLDVYRKLFAQISSRNKKPTYVLSESLPFQHHALATLARKHGYVQTDVSDFIQVFER